MNLVKLAKTIRNNQHFLPIFTFFLASFIFALPYLIENKIISSGETPYYINPSYLNYYSIWENKFNFGYSSPHSAHIIILSILWKVINSVFTYIDSSIVILFLSFLLPCLSSYYFLKTLIPFRRDLFIIIPASLYYSFNTFRLTGPLNTPVNLLFIFLPLFFTSYYLLLHSRKLKHLLTVIFVANLSGTMGTNVPVVLTPYMLLLAYFIFYLTTNKIGRQDVKKIFTHNIVFGLVIILSNLYWIYPVSHYLISQYHATDGASTIFKALNSGTFYDHIRGIGKWSWKEKHLFSLYFPYYENYYQPLLIITTYLLVLISFSHLVFKKSITQPVHQLKVFFSLLCSVSIVLVAGSKGYFGFVYNFLYNNFEPFKIFREPYAKFSPLYVFSTTFGLALSLKLILRKLKHATQLVIIGAVVMLVFVSSFPFFNTDALPIRKWNGGNFGNAVSIPEYWQEARRDIPSKVGDDRLMLFPYNPYITYYNWEYGVNVVGDIADYLLDVKTIKSYGVDNKSYGTDNSLGTNILLSTFPPGKMYNDIDIVKILGFINARYLILKNDQEWRYSNGDIASPSASLAYLSSSNLKLEKTYGEFTNEYLSTLPNEDPDPGRRQLLVSELQGKPILSLYQVPEEHLLPLVYTPSRAFVSTDDPSDLPYIVTDQPDNNFAVIFQNQNNKPDLDLNDLDSPEVFFSENHPTHISLTIKDADNPFLLVFIENYDSNWSIIPGKDFSQITDLPINFKKPYNTDHLIANGFSNAWLINPDQFCSLSPDDCELSNQGKNLSLSLYYSPQNYLTLSLILALIINLLVVSSLVYLLIFKKNK